MFLRRRSITVFLLFCCCWTLFGNDDDDSCVCEKKHDERRSFAAPRFVNRQILKLDLWTSLDDASSFSQLKMFVAAVHRHQPGQRVFVTSASSVPEHLLMEMRLWAFVVLLQSTAVPKDNFVFLPVTDCPLVFFRPRHLKPSGIGQRQYLVLNRQVYRVPDTWWRPCSSSSEPPCGLRYLVRPAQLVASHRHAPTMMMISNQTLCVLCGLFQGSGGGEETAFSTLFYPSLLDHLPSATTVHVALFLARQHEDPPLDADRFLQKLQTITEDSKKTKMVISMYLYHVPLTAPVTNLMYKWNVLGLEALRQGCHYFYQALDDAVITNPEWYSKGMELLLLQGGGGGAVGDGWREGLFNSFFFSRRHFSAVGAVFDPYLDNWYSDNWAHDVYGPALTQSFSFLRHAKPGTTYQVCSGAGHWMACGLPLYRRRMKSRFPELEVDVPADPPGCQDVHRIRKVFDPILLLP